MYVKKKKYRMSKKAPFADKKFRTNFIQSWYNTFIKKDLMATVIQDLFHIETLIIFLI